MKAIDRIYQYFDEKGIKPTAIEKQIGLSNGYLSVQKKRNADMGEGILNKLIDNFRDLSAEWLLTGEGRMFKSGLTMCYQGDNNKELEAIQAEKGIPLIPLEAMAGFGSGSSTQIMEYECDKYVVPNFSGAEFLIQVKGDSMFPKYASGDIIACKKLQLNTFFQWNKVYVIDSEQGVLIKRVNKAADPNHVLLVSDNANYEPFELPREEIISLAIVIGVIRQE